MELNRAFLVPQAGLQRDAQGPFVKVVGADGKVVQKRVASDLARGRELDRDERARGWRSG